MAKKTGGNPFYIKEMIQMLLAKEKLINKNGKISFDAKIVDDSDTSASIENVMQSRWFKMPPTLSATAVHSRLLAWWRARGAPTQPKAPP